jgi:hypothetical protein
LETDEPLDWGEIFFILHKHCNLDKWKIWNYTLPQVEVLCSRANRYIQFEISTRMPMLPFMGGNVDVNQNINNSSDDSEYQEVTAKDIDLLARILGGG